MSEKTKSPDDKAKEKDVAALSDSDRQAVNRDFQEEVCRDREVFGALTKADVRAAVNAADAWADANAAAFNTALPQPARGALTAAQKARLLAKILLKRYSVGA